MSTRRRSGRGPTMKLLFEKGIPPARAARSMCWCARRNASSRQRRAACPNRSRSSSSIACPWLAVGGSSCAHDTDTPSSPTSPSCACTRPRCSGSISQSILCRSPTKPTPAAPWQAGPSWSYPLYRAALRRLSIITPDGGSVPTGRSVPLPPYRPGRSRPKGSSICGSRSASGLSSRNSRLGWMSRLCWYLSLS